MGAGTDGAVSASIKAAAASGAARAAGASLAPSTCNSRHVFTLRCPVTCYVTALTDI